MPREAGVRLSVRGIKPAKGINPQVFYKAIGKQLKKEGKIIARLYKKTVRTWKRKPKFKVEKPKLLPIGLATSIYTTSDIYRYIDIGTRPRTIKPKKKGKFLKFKVGGTAKTRPKVIGSRRGSAGTQWVSTKKVRRHRIKARRFTFEIKKRRQPHFTINMKKAMARANRGAFK